MNAEIKGQLSYLYSLGRSAQFLMQNLSLPLLEQLLPGEAPKRPVFQREQIQTMLREMNHLLKKDAENISAGIYPVEVLQPEGPGRHLSRLLKIIYDGVALSKRRRDHLAHDFGPEARAHFAEVPEYFRRNFHFQTGGYLTKASAELYEHQVEILFMGAADAMRRLLIPLVKKVIPGDGEGRKFLEIGAGTGRLSRFMKLAYPKATITVTDVSAPYLKKAQERLRDLSGLNFVRAAAEDLPFRDESFDLVFSCFLFHELPAKVRKEVLREGRRVLKRGGAFGLVDSAQKKDTKFDWALRQFPVDFHEPFYKNYVEHPMEIFLKNEGYRKTRSVVEFFAKAVLAQTATTS